MIVLGLDTSHYANAFGVTEGDKVLADFSCDARADSLEQIVQNIDSALTRAGLTLKDVEGIGVGLGPGSWTGIRVGVTAGKMLAFSAGKPVVGVSTLEVLAYAACGVASLICAVIGAGAGDAVYAALYRPVNGSVERIGEYYVGDVKGLTLLLTNSTVLVGNGARKYADMVGRETGMIIKAVEALPGGASVACLAARRLERGEEDDVLSLTPLYLKESTAKAFINKYRKDHT